MKNKALTRRQKYIGYKCAALVREIPGDIQCEIYPVDEILSELQAPTVRFYRHRDRRGVTSWEMLKKNLVV